jgi:NAD(P)-dependent dehydrogenase (short-subunit alcohol dehydrogenase family)
MTADLTGKVSVVTGAARGQGRGHAVRLGQCGADISKHAITGMAGALGAELGKHRIRVNSLHPGAVHTPISGGNTREALMAAPSTQPGAWPTVKGVGSC